MRISHLALGGLIAASILLTIPAQAQLVGSDTAAGDSCASYPTGATRMTADADTNGLQVTLICNGTTWEPEGVVAVSKSGNPPTADGIWFSSGGDIYRSSGDVGIGTASPSVALDVVGDIHYTGVLQDVSDIRLKENIHPLDSPLKKITALNGFSFTMKGDPKHTVEYGVSAQDVQAVFPELVGVADPKNGTLGVNYQGLIAPMIEAIKIQQTQIEALEAKVKRLEANAHSNKPGEL